MLGSFKKTIGLLSALTISFGKSLSCKSERSIKCASLNSQPCMSTLVNVTSNETIYCLCY